MTFPSACLPQLPYPLLAVETPDAAERQISITTILEGGGVMMIPLAGLALLALILIVYYFFTVRRGTVVTGRFMQNAENALRNADYQSLLNYCHRRSELVARVTQKVASFITENPRAGIDDVKEIAEAEGSRQSNILAQRIHWLGDIGTIAPMVGLLGTVIGMIKSFLEISSGNFEGVRQMQLASGVSEALVTTATGLCIGIVAMIFHSFFRGRVNRYLAEFEAASSHLMTLVSAQLQQAPQPTSPANTIPANSSQHPTHEVVYPQSQA